MNDETFIISYTPGKHLIQRLNGSTKIILLAASLLLTMCSFDIRILIPTLALNLLFLLSIHPRWQTIRGLTYFIIVMNLFNILLMYLVNPTVGVSVIGQKQVWFTIIGRYVITPETLFYLGVRLLKIFGMFIASLWFILAITPTELGVGLYRLHVPYKACTVISLGLRSVPDILRNYHEIQNSLQMRGLELDRRRTSVFKRLRQSVKILLPLLLASFEKVDRIAAAMDLRLYGVGKKRTYYAYKRPTSYDYLFRGIAVIKLVVAVIFMSLVATNHLSSIWYPW